MHLEIVCENWEQSAQHFTNIAKNISVIRIGIVLATNGGFWAEMKKLAHFKILSPLGNGQQFISWVHIDDLCHLIKAIANNKIQSGTYNAVSSEPTTNRTMTKAIAKANNCPAWLPAVPAFLLKIVLGERAQELLNGQNASNKKLLQAGFTLQYDTLKKAIDNIK
jgi:uncharacterized protein (TIGR01777 family)